MTPSFKNFSIKKRGKNLLKILIGVVAVVLLLFILNIFVAPVRNFFYTVSYQYRNLFGQQDKGRLPS